MSQSPVNVLNDMAYTLEHLACCGDVSIGCWSGVFGPENVGSVTKRGQPCTIFRSPFVTDMPALGTHTVLMVMDFEVVLGQICGLCTI